MTCWEREEKLSRKVGQQYFAILSLFNGEQRTGFLSASANHFFVLCVASFLRFLGWSPIYKKKKVKRLASPFTLYFYVDLMFTINIRPTTSIYLNSMKNFYQSNLSAFETPYTFLWRILIPNKNKTLNNLYKYFSCWFFFLFYSHDNNCYNIITKQLLSLGRNTNECYNFELMISFLIDKTTQTIYSFSWMPSSKYTRIIY